MKQLYNMKEIYKAMYDMARNLRYLHKAQKQKLLSHTFIERIMLAVTEVNKCEMCSYAHTKMALEAGLTKQEIEELLEGESSEVPMEERTALLFAQHYADSRAYPSEKFWETLVNNYGEVKAKGILGVIRTITLGNAIGIPFGSLVNRIKRKSPDSRSTLGYEIRLIFMLLFSSPFAFIHGILSSCFNRPLLKTNNT